MTFPCRRTREPALRARVNHLQRFCNELLGKVTRHEESSTKAHLPNICIIGNGLREFSFDLARQRANVSQSIRRELSRGNL